MRSAGILFVMIAGSLTACQWGTPGDSEPAITKDTLKYSYKVIKQRAIDCDNKPDSACTVVRIRFPDFTAQQTLNDTIAQNLLVCFKLDDNKTDNSLQQLSYHFIKLYETARKSDKRPGLIYQLDAKAFVIRQDSDLLTLQFTSYGYMGGAHGGSSTNFLNWNARTNKRVALSEIFTGAYQAPLNTIAEKIFRRQEKLSDTASLSNGYFFKNNIFSLNDNYLISPIGIRFHYNEYEIKPYAAGSTDLLIPYSQIESLLRPNSVVSQYYR